MKKYNPKFKGSGSYKRRFTEDDTLTTNVDIKEIERYKNKPTEDEIKFLLKVKERLKGYACGEHKELDKMINNRIKEKK